MNRITAYIRQSLQEIYPPEEVKALSMLICCDMLGLDALDIYMGKDIILSECKQRELENIIFRLQKNEPIQYIRGIAEFCGRNFKVASSVLIPRPETEQLAEAAIDYLRKRPECRVLELCGGSGCIAITVAKTLPAANVTVLELSPEAMEYLRANMARHKADNVTAVQGDALCPPPTIQGPYDAILSNPPYIASGELPTLQKEVRQEPAMALDGGADGLDFYRGFNDIYPRMLTPGGLLLYEIGEEQGEAVAALLRNAGLERVAILRDVYGQPRNVLGYAPDEN